MEIKFAGDKEDHGAHGFQGGVAPRLAFGRLEQPIGGFKEAIGLPSMGPRHDALEVLTDHFGHGLHRFRLGPHDVGPPLLHSAWPRSLSKVQCNPFKVGSVCCSARRILSTAVEV